MTGLVTAAPHNSMIDLFARRSKVATRAIGMTDVLTPVQVRAFTDCEMRWFTNTCSQYQIRPRPAWRSMGPFARLY